MTAPAMPGTVRLSQVAPWDAGLRNTYRQRFTEVGGRFFLVKADSLSGPWFVHEITRDGGWLRLVALAWNLTAARQAIAGTVAGLPDEEVQRRANAAPSVGTGRNHPKHVDRRRAGRVK